ncbi:MULTISPECIES: hypothetical protein [Haloarcula]|uniref:hypothetical protein n=1 Tax=Haloarcula TaxID=2237 RepID=UPI000F8DC4D1|nr:MULTISPECIES: hypothetical protein [Haloarcula]NHX41676.1 hypothetical protein [Haloarcula sp. R1-2]
MEKNQLVELALYYIAMLLLVFFILKLSQAVVGDIAIWLEFGIILVVVFAYRYIAVWLGIDPSGRE